MSRELVPVSADELATPEVAPQTGTAADVVVGLVACPARSSQSGSSVNTPTRAARYGGGSLAIEVFRDIVPGKVVDEYQPDVLRRPAGLQPVLDFGTDPRRGARVGPQEEHEDSRAVELSSFPRSDPCRPVLASSEAWSRKTFKARRLFQGLASFWSSSRGSAARPSSAEWLYEMNASYPASGQPSISGTVLAENTTPCRLAVIARPPRTPVVPPMAGAGMTRRKSRSRRRTLRS